MRKLYVSLLLVSAMTVLSIASSIAITAHSTARAVTLQVSARTTSLRPLLHIVRTQRERMSSTVSYYTIQSGDTLSGLAAKFYGSVSTWPSLWWVNRSTIANPNEVQVGQRITLSSWHPITSWLLSSALSAVSPHMKLTSVVIRSSKVWDVTRGYPNYCGDGDGDGWDVSCHSASTAGTVTTYAQPASNSYYTGSGAMQQCIIRRESGGNASIWNASGHWGLYQFSEGTWIAHGGSAATFGRASVAEQNRIYYNTVAADGYSDWAPYDGC